ncbi:FMN-dependent NADH-azoreductase [Paraburkholderia sabiae]|uniref:FMN dependent NADH:quinone oxidoreductase n=1 Tax=Paraburkholderia sabiae TaxID=273251 RepID=A0ABU9Q6C8_9BURK|nr:NAD(P)H-dependent oxidoreductase [Paraburkholderia sabiae]WJZ78054.1 NAD(P)H-dependent oxidoreductase [Paraburkholderia sabiae]CAD6529648.1 FMN-dependent NADH-azoreductase 1 [Paraburkholderia sabiae]
MNILHIDCSPRRESHSRQLSAAIVAKLLTILPDAHIHRRDLGYEPIPHAGADYADALSTPASLAAAGRSADAVLLAEQLIEEVERSDVIVIGTPMNNFTVPSVLKAWIDQILRVGRTMQSTPSGKVGMLRDRPVFVGIASGGVFTGDRANQPDFLTPYLRAALGCIGLDTIHYLPLQGTAFIDDARAAELRRSLIAMIEPAMIKTTTLKKDPIPTS